MIVTDQQVRHRGRRGIRLALVAVATSTGMVAAFLGPLDAAQAMTPGGPRKASSQKDARKATLPRLDGDAILSDPVELRKQGILVQENVTHKERGEEWIPEINGIQPAHMTNCSNNCLSFAVALADRVTGGSMQVTELSSDFDVMVYNWDVKSSIPFHPAKGLWDVLKEVRDDSNPRAQAIVRYNWESPDGEEGGHVENVIKNHGMVGLLNLQDSQNKWASVRGFKITNVAYARVDGGVPPIHTRWLTGNQASTELGNIINGPELTQGFVQGTLDGDPVQ